MHVLDGVVKLDLHDPDEQRGVGYVARFRYGHSPDADSRQLSLKVRDQILMKAPTIVLRRFNKFDGESNFGPRNSARHFCSKAAK